MELKDKTQILIGEDQETHTQNENTGMQLKKSYNSSTENFFNFFFLEMVQIKWSRLKEKSNN